jgi:hypothetical protein
MIKQSLFIVAFAISIASIGGIILKAVLPVTQDANAPYVKPCHYEGLEGKTFVYGKDSSVGTGKIIKVNCAKNTVMELNGGQLYIAPSDRKIEGFEVVDFSLLTKNPWPTPSPSPTPTKDQKALKDTLESTNKN